MVCGTVRDGQTLPRVPALAMFFSSPVWPEGGHFRLEISANDEELSD